MEYSEEEWQVIGSTIKRDTEDIKLCNVSKHNSHLLKMTAYSDAGDTTVFYRVTLRNLQGF